MEISSMDGAFTQTLNDNMSDPVPTTTNNNNELQNHLATYSENENNFISTLPNKPEVKIKKHDEAKVMTDSNENSLSVDTLIEILSSSNGTTSNNLPEKMTSSSSSTPKTTARAAKASATLVKIKSSSDLKMKAPAAAVKKSSTSSVNSSSKKPIAKAVNSKKLASPLFGGKPTITDLNRKMKQAAAAKQRQPRTVYQSQISDNSVGIKICIKKSINSQKKVPSGGSSSSSSSKASPATSTSSSSAAKLKRRSRKSKLKERAGSDSEDGYVKRRKKATPSAATSEQKQKQQESSALDDGPVQEQSRWATHMPKEILFEIFKKVVNIDGSVPAACRLARVCRVWRDVALDDKLWRKIDLSTYFKESNRTELRLKWFLENRMLNSEEVNMSFWKVTNTMCVLIKLDEFCANNLRSLSLAGWRALSSDDLKFIADKFPNLASLDLSSINTEINTSKTAVGLNSLVTVLETMKDRLTHLTLAHNRLSGIPQITTALTLNCPNLLLLDLSNVVTVAVSHGILHVEKLQEGCQKLKVLRIANSHIQLSPATLQEQMQSPGFPELEELSVASLADESRLMSDEALQRILKCSTKLKLLDVRGCLRLHHDSLIRIPAWDLKHLFLSGCSVTRNIGSGLELIASKWAHSLTEFDLAWASVQGPLDNALRALADKRDESPLSHLNLCGSAVSVEAVKEVLNSCPNLRSINLSSCRGLPRGIKRLLKGEVELRELRESLNEDP